MAYTEAHCCRLLGLSAAASLEETRAAYRSIARRMHPDRVGGDAEGFKEITAAYNWLVALRSGRVSEPRTERRRKRPARPTAERRARARQAWEQARAREARRAKQDAEQARADADQAAERVRREQARARAARQRMKAARRKARETKRAQADSRWDEEFTGAWEAWCKTAERYHAGRGGETGGAERSAEADPGASDETRPWTPPPAGPADSAERPADDADSIFGRMRRGFRRMARKAALDRVGQDVSLRLPIANDLLMKGGTRTIAITRAGACPSCAGAGGESCVCGGVGRIKLRETVKVTVPPGARSGARLRLEGKGTAGLDGAPDGDLFLLLEPDPIAGFRADGLDLHGQVTLSRSLAGQGGTVAVELPGGKVKLNVPEGSRTSDTFRLRGQGIPAWGGGERGDLFLSVVLK